MTPALPFASLRDARPDPGNRRDPGGAATGVDAVGSGPAGKLAPRHTGRMGRGIPEESAG
ncbi:MAG: hypothetical protein D3908_12710 [Candidatus Electrothrix sp. AUS4]|nr:hypothetical protein [Candidatus Electrothrix sp. AUS4]